jgi:hypothetical protein
MIYLIATADDLELPLATAGSLNELAKMCGVRIPYICRIIKDRKVTKRYQGVPARIYKFMEDEQ